MGLITLAPIISISPITLLKLAFSLFFSVLLLLRFEDVYPVICPSEYLVVAVSAIINIIFVSVG